MKTPLEELVASRAVIADPAHWTKGCVARDAKGVPCGPETARAQSFCALGALEKGTGRNVYMFESEAYKLMLKAIDNPNWGGLGPYNDTHTHEEMLAVFDKAIELAKAAEVPKS